MLDQDIPMVQQLLMRSFVQRLKSYVIWVQTGVIQVGFYLLTKSLPVRKDQRDRAYL